MKTTRIVALIFVLSIVGFGSLSHPHTAGASPSSYPITGYAWSENIGWLDLNCSNTVGLCSTNPFGLSVDPSGNITGYAWSENIGWVSANPSDLTNCPQAPCTATITNGALSGWMKVLSADGTTTLVTVLTPATTTYTTAGTQSFIVPAGVTSLTAALKGAGGATTTTTIAVTPGETLTVIIGSNGATTTLMRGATTLAVGTGVATTTFATKVDYVMANATGLAFADLNGDGKLDMAVTEYGASVTSNTTSIFLGNGNGTFGAKTDYITGTSPNFVAFADINNDGKIDMVLTNTNSDSISVRLGNGNGTFGARTDYGTGTFPTGIALADISRDGKIDIVVTNFANGAGNTASVFLGNGNGTFGAKVDYTTGPGPFDVALTDLNGDGKLDMVVSNSGSNSISVRLGNGNGTFGTKVDYTTGADPRNISLADVNSDGKTDVVTLNHTANSISVLLGNGNGTFGTKVDYTTGTGPKGLAVGDVNGDSYADVVVGNNTANNGSTLLNKGDGTFATKTDFTTGLGPVRVGLADLNGDGKSDMVVSNSNSNTVSVFLNTTPISIGTAQLTYTATSFTPGTPIGWYGFISLSSTTAPGLGLITGSSTGMTFAPHVDYVSGDGPYDTAAGDLNADGKADIVVAAHNASVASVFINNGNGTFAAKVDYPTGSLPNKVAIGDVNGDGKNDIVTANSTSTRAISVLINNGNGTFAPKVDYAANTTGGNALALGDLNGDGNNDIVQTHNSATSGVATVFLNSGSGTFPTKVDYLTGSSPVSAVADINGDGKNDIVTANYVSNTISVLINNGNGTFAAKVDYPTGSSPKDITIGDVNGDGKLDIVTANANANTVSVFLNNGNGTFAPKVDYATGNYPTSVTLADTDGDGIKDIIVANYNSAAVSVFLNNGNGTFAPKIDYSTGSLSDPNGVAVADFNSDNKNDIVADSFGGGASVFLNTTIATILYTYATSTPPSYGITSSAGVFSGYSWSDDVMGWTDWSYASTTYGTCIPSYSCSGNQITYTNSSCVTSNYGSMCVAPAFCSSGSASCLYPSPAVNPGGALSLSPKLVPTGKTTTVSWNIANVVSCTTVGTNGDSWSGLSGSKTSKAINSQVTYTLSCIPYDPLASLFTQTATLNLVPTYHER